MSSLDNSTKKILILGGAGFLGANLVRRCLKEENVALTVVDSLNPMFKSSLESLEKVKSRIEFFQEDILNEEFLAKVIPDKDIIFNCAAQTSHPLSIQDPIMDAQINCIGNLRVLEALRKLNPKAIIVYASSSTVIGRALKDIVDEDHVEKPLDIYSANKSVAEKYYRIYNRIYDIPTVSLRFANLYGPFGKNDSAFGFINYFINQAAQGLPIKIFGEGDQTRNIMFVDDAVDVMWEAAQSPKLFGESFFAVHDEHYSVKEIAKLISETFGNGWESVPWPDLRKRMEINNVKISSNRLKELINWRPQYSFKQGLELTKIRMKGDY